MLPGPVSLDRVVTTEVLESRPSRAPDYLRENESLREISRQLSISPQAALQALVEQAVQLCRAESAGVSLAERDPETGQEFFRWHAVAGRLAPFLNATLPRYFSPCGEVLDRRSTLLMSGMVGHYEYVGTLGMPLPEVLLVPFFQKGEPIGTVWVVHHSDGQAFEREDKRLLESLAEFTSGIARAYYSVRDLEKTVADLNAERAAREQMVDTITHDLRTPITATKLAAQVLQRKLESEVAHKSLQRVIFNMDRAERMIRDMLDARRLKAGEGLPVMVGECRLDVVIQAAVKDLSDLHGPRFELANALGEIRGSWDDGGIQRIVENLGTNAVKYGSEDKPVTVALRVKNNAIEISVHNEGAPIGSQDQEALFKPFRRSEAAIRAGKKGWGLGLTLVKGLAEAHGGKVNVRSSADDGTTFSVELPSATPLSVQHPVLQ